MRELNTSDRVQALEKEVEQLRNRLKNSYETHANTVAKFESEIASLNTDLESAYQIREMFEAKLERRRPMDNESKGDIGSIDERLDSLQKQLEKSEAEHKHTKGEFIRTLSRIKAVEKIAARHIALAKQANNDRTKLRHQVKTLERELLSIQENYRRLEKENTQLQLRPNEAAEHSGTQLSENYHEHRQAGLG